MKHLLPLCVLLSIVSNLFAQSPQNGSLVYDGLQRDYILYAPSNYSDEAQWPLIVNMHGFTLSASDQASRSQLHTPATEEGFFVAYPNALNSDWNANDNAGFIDKMLNEIETEYSIDASRIYATGFSQGGAMSYALGVLLPDRIAAIADVAGGVEIVGDNDLYPPLLPTVPKQLKPLLHIHGARDPVADYDGSTRFAAVEDVVGQWVVHNGGETPLMFEPLTSSVDLYSCADCDTYVGVSGDERVADVLLYRFNEGGHEWPHAPVNANAAILDFFSRHELPLRSDSDGEGSFTRFADVQGAIDRDLDGVGDRAGRAVPVSRANRMMAKFDLPDGISDRLDAAKLRVYLEDVRGTPPDPLSLSHSVEDNDFEPIPINFEDPTYVDTSLEIVQPDDLTGQFYEIEVTDLVRMDYALDGANPRSAFRLQVPGTATAIDLRSNSYAIATTPRNLKPTLILTTIPEPSTISLGLTVLAALVCCRWLLHY